jgi:uncharacterized protein
MEKKADIDNKLKVLKDLLLGMKGVLVAYSGGVDSTLVLKLAHDLLGERCLAVTATSPLYPDSELLEAKEVAGEIGVRHLVIESDELRIPGFSKNPRNRCYLCKLDLFSRLYKIAKDEGLSYILDGSNLDDTSDHRPGMQAAREFGVRSPLIEAGLTKAEARELSRQIGLPNWKKPPMACLASRFPYGGEITREALRMVERAEDYIKGLGVRQVRVRHYSGGLCRIEVDRGDLEKVFNEKDCIVSGLRDLGYNYVTLDLQGYRTGSMNEPYQTAPCGRV